MKKRNVISSENLLPKSPIIPALVFYLCFDKWHAPEWLYGVVGFIYLIWLITWIIDLFNVKNVDIFDKEYFKNKENE